MMITEVLVPAQEIAWLPWAVQYFFYIGSAYGAAVLFALSLFFLHKTSHSLRSVLALVLAVSALIGPLALTAELHQPGRAWHFFVYFTPNSWMSRGAVLLPLFSLLAVLTAWLYLRSGIQCLNQHPNRLIRKLPILALGQWQTSLKAVQVIAVITLLSGLSIAVYTGMEVAVVASRPLWNQLTSPLLWFVTAFLGTCGLTILTLAAMKQITLRDVIFVRQVILSTAILACLIFPLWLVNGHGLTLIQYDFWLWNIGLQMLLFVGCILLSYRISTSYSQLIGVSVLAIIACWSLRWITLIGVQTIPHYDGGLYPHILDWGVSGIIGMAGLWLALAVIISAIITRSNSASHVSPASTAQGEYHE